MEQQKTLWIIFSVALFILVIVGVGVIWFLPGRQAAQVQTASAGQGANQPGVSFDPYQWAKTGSNNYPGLEPAPKTQSGSNFTIIYGQPQNPQSAGPQTSTTPAPSTGTAVAPTPPPPQAPRATVATPPPAAAPAPAPAPRVVQRPAPAPRPTHLVRVTQRWIQVASYTSDFRAEQTKKNLQSKGISSTIMSHQIGKRTFFRVRIGPYATEQEAQVFLDQIKKVSGFQNSYIDLVYSYRSAN